MFALSKEELKDISDHFGLKYCRNITIHIPLDGVVTITAELYPEIDGVRQLLTRLKHYRLEEIR